MSRLIGAMPQLVHGKSRFLGTYLRALAMVAATCVDVSTLLEATSITPTSTSLPLRSPSSSIGTCEFAHSSDTCLMRLFASAGNIFSYCRQFLPSVLFQSTLALMP